MNLSHLGPEDQFLTILFKRVKLNQNSRADNEKTHLRYTHYFFELRPPDCTLRV